MTQLSLSYVADDIEVHHGTHLHKTFNHQSSIFHDQITRIVSSIASFRIADVCIDWKFVAFSARLFELRLNMIILAGSSEVAGFMCPLSSASQLQEIMLVQILAFTGQDSMLP
jgi:hypothetical protein